MYINFNKFKISIFLFIFLFLFIHIKNEIIDGIQYPTLLTLLSQKIVMVANDGIHFFTSNDNSEDTTKKIIFEPQISSAEENKKTTLAQFSADNGGYIIILVMDILYIFDPDGNKIDSYDLREYINAIHYCLIPYKKENNLLYFIIVYPNKDLNFVLSYNKFNINSKIFENITSKTFIIKTKTYNNTPSKMNGVNCIFMKNSTMVYDLLVCFYSVYYPSEIHARFFDPNNNFEELTEYFQYYHKNDSFFPNYVSGVTGENKDKALIYIPTDQPNTMTFDLKEGFSEPIRYETGNYLSYDYSNNKIFYFRQIHEYLCASKNNGCTFFLISFNENFSFKNKNIFTPDYCWNSFSFSVYFDGTLYSVVTDNGNDNSNRKIIIQVDTSLGTSKVIEDPIIIDDNNPLIENTIETNKNHEYKTEIYSSNPETTINSMISEIFFHSDKISINKNINFETTSPNIETTIIETSSPIFETTNIETSSPTIETMIIETTSPIIETTNIETTYSIIDTTIIGTSSPNIETSSPTIETTNIETSSPNIETTNIETSSPNIDTTIIETTSHIIETTNIETTYSIIDTTIIGTSSPNIETSSPTIETTNIETSSPNIETTIIETSSPDIETTNIKTSSPTIDTTIIEITSITVETENYLNDVKCKTSNVESAIYNLCLSCNIEKGYFPPEVPINYFPNNFIDCYNNDTKPINFYFNSTDNKYKICFETCLTCEKGGDEYENNCLSCDINHIKRPETPNTTNCVPQCLYAYYYTSYGQYKCTDDNNCPENAKFYIKNLKKCTNNCKNENIYKYQYDGQCLENCPTNTLPNNNICKDVNFISCSKSESEIDLKEFLTTGGVDFNAKNYAEEFGYTTKHISLFYNNLYSILLYKDSSCVSELNINMPKIDFGNCYSKIQKNLSPPTNDKIIISIIEKLNGNKKSSISYSFYHPETGEKINSESICKDEEVIIKESVLSQLNNSKVDINSIFYLAGQEINIFNISDDFYTDLCYHFESPNGKDVPLKDRILAFFPNITLCDEGCENTGVNLTSMESICQCKFSDIMSNELIEGNALIKGTVDEVMEMISSSNLLVLKCYKDVFKKEYFIKNTGGFIFLFIILCEIILLLIFLIS